MQLTDTETLEALVLAEIRSGRGATKVLGLFVLEGLVRESGGGVGDRARSLIAQFSSSADPSLAGACAGAIAAEEDWRGYLTDLLLHVPLTSSVAAVVAAVLQQRAPQHLLATMIGIIGSVIPAFDLQDDGKWLTLRTDIAAVSDRALLIGLENPLEQATAVHVFAEGGALVLDPEGDSVWLDRARAACPPSLLIFESPAAMKIS